MDFSKLKAVETSNKRQGGGLPPKVQEFDDMKYRKAPSKKSGLIGKFYIGDKRIEELSLATVNALRHFNDPTDKNSVFIAVVADKDAKMLRKRENKDKGNNFKSDAFEAALTAAGLIDPSLVKTNQFLSWTSVGKGVSVDGISCVEIFQIGKGTKKAQPGKAKAEAQEASAKATGTVDGTTATSAPTEAKAEQAPQATTEEASPATAAAPPAASATGADDWT